jgi:hypothetical protein
VQKRRRGDETGGIAASIELLCVIVGAPDSQERENTTALNDAEIATVKGMLVRGDRQHDIAAYFGINGGRIGEISTGIGSTITASAVQDLPAAGPYMAGRSALRARDTLTALRDLTQEAINDIDLFEKPPRRFRPGRRPFLACRTARGPMTVLRLQQRSSSSGRPRSLLAAISRPRPSSRK